MTFKEFLIEKNIPFIESNEGYIDVSDEHLYIHEKEIKELFPLFIFFKDVEPNKISD